MIWLGENARLMDRQDEILAQREEIENLETDDWSM